MFEDILKLSLGAIAESMPAESFTLREAVEGRRTLRLRDGSTHQLRNEEIESLANRVPKYLWGLVKLPFVIVKTNSLGAYKLGGDRWSVEAINILLNRKEGAERLSGIEVEKLLKEFNSLIFIGLGIDDIQLDE